MQEPSFTDIDVLATILQHTEAVVVNAGTVLLDALVNDRPAVCVLYDEGAPPGESWAAKSVIGEHYRDVAESRRLPRGALVRGGHRRDRALPREPRRARGGAAGGDGDGRRPRGRAERRARGRRDPRPHRRMSAPAIVGIYRAANAGPRRAAARARARRGLVDRLVGARPRRAGRSRRTPWARAPGRSCRSSTRRLGGSARREGRSCSPTTTSRSSAATSSSSSRWRRAPGSASPSRPMRAGREVSHGITRAQPRSRARLTTFVESGPLVAIAPEWVDRVTAAPAWRGMGWGLELDWIDLQAEGCRLGIVDAVRSCTSARSAARTTTRRSGRACARSSRRGGRGLGAAPADARRRGGRGGAAPRGWAADAAALAAADARRVDEPARRPLVLARRRARDRGAPPLPGLPRVRPGAPDRARPQSARPRPSSRRARPSSPRSTACRTRASARPSAARGARSARSPRLGPRRPPPAAFDPEEQRFEGLRRYYEAAGKHFRGRLSVGVAGRAPPAVRPAPRLRLELPEREREAARTELDGRRSIAVMPAGSGARRLYPSPTSWLLDPRRARAAVPRCGFHARRPARRRRRAHHQRDRARRGRPPARLAAARGRRVRPAAPRATRPGRGGGIFVSPHTGFGFAALAVGTPWLTLSGGDWHEYFFNGVPFHSVLPSKRPTTPPSPWGGRCR